MIALTGPPGVGKTRLARELAAVSPHSVTLVDLAAVTDPALVVLAAARALSAQEAPGSELIECVVAHLDGRELLLVLDNCEHLLGACVELVDTLVARCPGLSVLATSREPLGSKRELVWRVAPLAAPGLGVPPAPERLIEFASVKLFVERATIAQPGFALSAYVAPAVAEICRRLDGLPLAIELAAACLPALTPGEIAARLEQRIDLAVGGGDSDRHRSLEIALDGSYDLLSEAEQGLLRRLSVFVGSFDLQAVEAVCAGGAVVPGQVHRLVSALASKSLIATEPDSGRWRLLETVRVFAGERLEQAEGAAVVREAHAAYFLALAESAEPGLTGPEQAKMLERLSAEHGNLRRALEWSLGSARGEWALRLAGALVLFWRVRCYFREGKDLLEGALSASAGEDPGLRAKALWGAGFLTVMVGDAEGAVPSLEQSLAIFRARGDLRGTARALLILANCNQSRGGAGVLPMLQESAGLAREAGDSWCLAHSLAVAGFQNCSSGDLPAGRVLFEDCLAVAREAHDDQALRIGLIGLGQVALHQGEYGSAEMLLEEALDVATELEEDYSRAEALQYLGCLALDRGDYPRARHLLEESLGLIPERSAPEIATGTLLILARVAHASGDLDGARSHFDRALAVTRSAVPPYVASQWMADLAIDNGEPEAGRRLLEEALAHARAEGKGHFAAAMLHGLGRVARCAGESRKAMALHREAIQLQSEIGVAPAIVASIEALAGLVARAGRERDAARLIGAASVYRDRHGYAGLPWESITLEADLGLIRAGLGAAEFELAFAAGRKLSLERAVALASSENRRPRPSSGWASLTEREQQVAALAAQGLSNPEIAECLVIARETVKDHLAQIFPKLGVRRRGELAREAWRGAGSAGLGWTIEG